MDKRLLLLALSTTLAACGGDDSPDPEETTSEPLTVEWAACAEGPGSCATVEVPLDWDAPAGETLPFFVRRIPAAEGPSKGQLWLLEGGPGAAGWAFAEAAPVFQAMAPGFDLYLPDYRGTGHSSWLGCDGESAWETTPACLESLQALHGDRLRHYDTTSAARDIGHTIEAIRAPGEPVYVYGVSYGTFVANRYLTLFPEQADAALLDSVCPASGCDVQMDRNHVEVVRFLFESCGDDAQCSARLGDDPWGRFLDLLGRLEAGHCSDFIGYPSNQILLEQLVAEASVDPATAAVATATVRRLERCDEADVAALERLVDYLQGDFRFGPAAGEGSSFSAYLSDHVVFSEFWPEGLDLESAEALLAELPMEMGALRRWAESREVWSWPASHTPADLYRWADTRTPVLLLNGNLDAQTPIGALDGAKAHFSGPGQQLLEVPLAGHGVLFTSAAVGGDETWTCGLEIGAAFFADPKAPLQAGCIDEIPPIDFAGSPALAQAVFGTTDLYENGTSEVFGLAPALRTTESRALEGLRRRLAEAPRF